LDSIAFIAKGGRTCKRLGFHFPCVSSGHEDMSIPKRVPSAQGLARARLMYSSTSCSSAVGFPELYSVVAACVIAACVDKPTANHSTPTRMTVLRLLTFIVMSYLPIPGYFLSPLLNRTQCLCEHIRFPLIHPTWILPAPCESAYSKTNAVIDSLLHVDFHFPRGVDTWPSKIKHYVISPVPWCATTGIENSDRNG